MHKAHKAFEKCCGNRLNIKDHQASTSSYIGLLSRGGLLAASKDLNDVISKSFALLDATSTIIRSCDILSRQADLLILQKFIHIPDMVCENHLTSFSNRILRTVCNCFFDSQRKRSNENVTEERVRSFKKVKRSKD